MRYAEVLIFNWVLRKLKAISITRLAGIFFVLSVLVPCLRLVSVTRCILSRRQLNRHVKIRILQYLATFWAMRLSLLWHLRLRRKLRIRVYRDLRSSRHLSPLDVLVLLELGAFHRLKIYLDERGIVLLPVEQTESLANLLGLMALHSDGKEKISISVAVLGPAIDYQDVDLNCHDRLAVPNLKVSDQINFNGPLNSYYNNRWVDEDLRLVVEGVQRSDSSFFKNPQTADQVRLQIPELEKQRIHILKLVNNLLLFNTAANAVQNIVLSELNLGADSVTIFGTSFFVGDDIYREGYLRKTDLGTVRSMLVTQDSIANFLFLKNCSKRLPLHFDDSCGGVERLTERQYCSKLGSQYGL